MNLVTSSATTPFYYHIIQPIFGKHNTFFKMSKKLYPRLFIIYFIISIGIFRRTTPQNNHFVASSGKSAFWGKNDRCVLHCK